MLNLHKSRYQESSRDVQEDAKTIEDTSKSRTNSADLNQLALANNFAFPSDLTGFAEAVVFSKT